MFGSERLTGALLDRLTHHVHILEMNGDSYRLKGSRQDATASSAPEPPWRVALPGPSAHGPRSNTNAQIRAVSHCLGGTLSLRPVVCFAAALDTAGLTTAAALTVDTEAS